MTFEPPALQGELAGRDAAEIEQVVYQLGLEFDVAPHRLQILSMAIDNAGYLLLPPQTTNSWMIPLCHHPHQCAEFLRGWSRTPRLPRLGLPTVPTTSAKPRLALNQ